MGEWLTHPAFTAFNTKGLWVGKFETSKKDGEDNVRNGSAVQIKPNVSSWKNVQVANAFYTSYDYKRKLESHMMKNTEWGAVAYLTWSKYGLGLTDIRFNNNSDSLTGYAAVNEPTCGYTGTKEQCNYYGTTEDVTQPYNTKVGYLASTTGNISGIYDMSGGSQEMIMAVMADKDGNLISGSNVENNSNFVGSFTFPLETDEQTEWTLDDNGLEWPAEKYYDLYEFSNTSIYNDRGVKNNTVNGYNTVYIKVNNMELANNESQNLYLVLKMKDIPNTLTSEVLNREEGYKIGNLAEINGYKTANGYIDIDSMPGNIVETNRFENGKYEDDESKSPTLIFKNPSEVGRTISGVIFEDATTGEWVNTQTRQSTANNQYDEKDTLIYGASVQLIQILADGTIKCSNMYNTKWRIKIYTCKTRKLYCKICLWKFR